MLTGIQKRLGHKGHVGRQEGTEAVALGRIIRRAFVQVPIEKHNVGSKPTEHLAIAVVLGKEPALVECVVVAALDQLAHKRLVQRRTDRVLGDARKAREESRCAIDVNVLPAWGLKHERPVPPSKQTEHRRRQPVPAIPREARMNARRYRRDGPVVADRKGISEKNDDQLDVIQCQHQVAQRCVCCLAIDVWTEFFEEADTQCAMQNVNHGRKTKIRLVDSVVGDGFCHKRQHNVQTEDTRPISLEPKEKRERRALERAVGDRRVVKEKRNVSTLLPTSASRTVDGI